MKAVENKTSFSKLSQIQQSHQFSFEPGGRPMDWLCWTRISSGKKHWKMLIYDEHHDINKDKQLIYLFLMLYSLEDYRDSKDYTDWSKEYMVQPPNFLAYYQSLNTIYNELEELIGEIDSFISPMDYELRTGEYAELLKG